jgi:hypothetical protein
MSTTRGRVLRSAAARGALAGLGGVAVMTVGEKAEQALTGRPDSYVPARTMMTLMGRSPSDADRPTGWNWAMHFGTGAVVGALRGMWSATGIRGAQASAAHTVIRLATDQTLENATGAGAPPATWPTLERVVDYLHKSVYAFTTGAITDAWIRPELQSARGRVSH